MVDRIPQNVAEKYTLAEVSRYRPAICVAFEQDTAASVFRVEMLGIRDLENLDKVIWTGADQRNVAVCGHYRVGQQGYACLENGQRNAVLQCRVVVIVPAYHIRSTGRQDQMVHLFARLFHSASF